MGFRLLFRCLAMAAGSTPHGPKQTAFFGPGPDRAQTEPLVLDRRQTGPDRSKRYIRVAIVIMTQRVNNDYKVPQLRFIQY
ncbi:hypothetical protein MP228_005893 [Amoeboaphelidium protococcarum]|nr:hypothetical protein MP228_005893 [Amoeboaphelidium protococcarum]